MGGTAAVAAATVAAKSLFDQHQANKEATKKHTNLKVQNAIERKKALNLFDEAMAARRAKLSQSGLINSNSAVAYMNRENKNALDSINENSLQNALKSRDISDDYRRKSVDIWASTGQSLLK